jgi:Tol biopolymer transport system component
MHWQQATKGSWPVVISTILLGADLAMSQFDIQVVEIKTGRVVQISSISDAEEFNPSWSPNGKQIAHDAVDPAWSPNSKRLAFQQPSDGSIWTADESGGLETFVVASGFNPIWSPNGQWISFADGGDIWKVRVNIFGIPLAPPVQVTTDPAFENQPSWSNNSMTIVFHSNADGDFDLWTIPASGGTATKLTGLAGQGDFDPSFSNNGQFVAYSGFTEPPSLISGLSHEFAAPNVFSLAQNFPNPFNPETEIHFQIPIASHVVMKIFNAVGEEIRTLVSRYYEAGYHSMRWDGKAGNGQAVASGVYLYQFRAGRFMEVKKMSLLR